MKVSSLFTPKKLVIMKILSLFAIAIAISFSASAQTTTDTTTHHKTHHQYSNTSTNHERYMMKNGKLMSEKNGTNTDVTNDVTLSNGTTITTDGKVTWKNGKSQTLQNGEMVDMNGKIHNWSSSSTHKMTTHHTGHHNMSNNADSTK
jgi:cytoskeletal protein RodZ